MGLQRLLANAAMAAADATKRLSHGLLFLAGGLMTLADHRRSAAGAHENSPRRTADALSGLNRVEEQAYQPVVPPGARLCVIGCGTGRDVLPFVARGHQVVAVDSEAGAVATLLRLLDERGFSAQVICGYGEEAALPGLFDSVILSPHCYGYMPGAARRIALLARLRSHLEPGGRIAINFLPRSGPLHGGGLRIAAATARLTGSDCPWEPNDIVRLVHGPRGRYVLYEHYSLAEEVVDEARRAGLRPHGTDAPAVPGLVIVGR